MPQITLVTPWQAQRRLCSLPYGGQECVLRGCSCGLGAAFASGQRLGGQMGPSKFGKV